MLQSPQLNVKSASDGGRPVDLAGINHAVDTAMKSAGIQLSDAISAQTADSVFSPDAEDLEALKTIAG